MTARYRQFLGSKPGTLVELIDDSSSPYVVRTAEGLEYLISADDFRTYYKPEGDRTPARWDHLITDPENGTVEAGKAAGVVNIVRSFEEVFQDFFKARSFVRDVLRILDGKPAADISEVRDLLEDYGWRKDQLTEEGFSDLLGLDQEYRRLLLSDSVASIRFLDLHVRTEVGHEGPAGPAQPTSATGTAEKKRKKSSANKAERSRRVKTKNVEMSVEGDVLTLTVDLAKDFGPSKSGKTTIVASTEGNKTIPGREERIGLNIYRQETKKKAKGRKNEFKNVLMAVTGEVLTITVDLSQEFGDSKSGKTTIVASTGGNQLVYGREEKIGLNVYKNKS